MANVKYIAETLGKYGCYSISGVYSMVGVMALLSFLGQAKDAADEDRIINVILEIPFGEVLISVLILGLLGYVCWRVYEAFADPYNFGSSLKGKAQRTGIGLSALGYILLAFGAAEILIQGGGDSEGEQQLFVAKVLGWKGGQILVGVAGLIVGFTSLIQIKYIYGGDYNKRMKYDNMPPWVEKATHITAWAGYIARSIILGVLGFFFVKAAVLSDSDEVGDTDTAFDFLGSFGTIGHIMFIAVALGTICYGIFMLISGYHYSFKRTEGDEK